MLFSLRYGESPFTLKTMAWALGLSSVFVVSAIYLGWALFDITTYGAWSFFNDDVPANKRWFQAAISVLPMFAFVAAAVDRDKLSARFFGGSDTYYDLAYQIGYGVFLIVHSRVFENTGLFMMSGFLVTLVPNERKMAFVLGLALCAAFVLGYLGNLGATHGAMLIFILFIAVSAWLAFVAMVEILSALRWHDAGDVAIVAGLVCIAAIGLVLALIIPFLMVFVLYAIMVLTPESVSNDWVNLVGPFRGGGVPAAIVLSIACIPPLLPTLWIMCRGLGTLIARNTPMMSRFIAELKVSEGPLNQSGFDNLMRPYRNANVLGFGVSTVATFALLAAALWILSTVFTVTG
ncbi:hypothetical protein [Ruegeria arenilitoris]|uniref:hypothetical protein n=1 Tax=Ruegeria arenilitoris TaxID=1173585 RepID=UPI0014818578|nr:hypothetical protein [Ruegeria arenilitoris]